MIKLSTSPMRYLRSQSRSRSRCSLGASGFTLVELSIVIVIIGLIIAGITTGKSLVKQAQVRALATNVDKVKVAVNSFKLQYNGLPGDINNASSYWGGAANPGNFDGRIQSHLGATSGDIQNNESFAAWQHLALAGLIQGSYTGVNGAGPVIGGNVPESGYGNKTTMWFTTTDLWSTYPMTSTKLIVGGTASNGWTDYRINIIDASNLDTKIDDGLPYSGNMVTFTDTNAQCVLLRLQSATRAQKIASIYQLTNATDACSIIFPITGGTLKP